MHGEREMMESSDSETQRKLIYMCSVRISSDPIEFRTLHYHVRKQCMKVLRDEAVSL